MLTTTLLAPVLLAAGIVLPAAIAPVPASASVRGNPVVAVDAPDPTVLRAPDGWYAYATGSAGIRVQVFRSRDLVSWARVGEALPRPPSWANPAAGMMWAPGAAYVGGRYVLFVSLQHRASGRMCIARAESSSPAGPFVPDPGGPFVCQLDLGGSIDPDPFIDAGGVAWLLWKSDDNCCGRPAALWSQRLSADGRRLEGSRFRLLRADLRWERGVVENPSMLRVDGTLHLTYSGGWWDSAGYAVGHAVCDTPAGPCRRTNRRPVLETTGAVAGPGGQDLFVDPAGGPRIVYAAWDAGRVGYPHGMRSMRVDAVSARGGRLVVHGPTLARA